MEGYNAITLPDLLAKHSYGKIYIMLGINGLYAPHDMILEEYQILIDLIRETQPDAIIVIQSIMTVNRFISASRENYRIEKIHSLNEQISQLVVGENMFYIDINELFADEEGYLPDEMSKDGIHLYSDYYDEWAQWLMDKAATFGIE